ncbi:hypothetical protein [Bacillus albus]|uniref:hypothetical protein n=1 Tax=Bacillus albus TaxID=2026189 RepID=UPI0013F4D17D|nr:hypothetical protein [Bacillus albus]WJE70007.1 hypothetical protein QRY64_25285 [Bacillus albus]
MGGAYRDSKVELLSRIIGVLAFLIESEHRQVSYIPQRKEISGDEYYMEYKLDNFHK